MNSISKLKQSVVRMWLSVICLTLLGQVSSFAASFALEGQNNGDTNTWVGGNVLNWKELDYIPCRFRITSGPVSNQTVTLSFPGITAGTPGLAGLFNFTGTPNVQFVSPPTLSAPAGGNWSCTFVINVTDGNPASVNFRARLAAGAHLNVGSSLKISPDPSAAGVLQIHKPSPGPGVPDLAIVKTGPATIAQGDTITYNFAYTNKATGTNTAMGVQVTDILPSYVVVDPATLPANAALVGNTVQWDLTNVAPQTGGQFTFQALVPFATPSGTVLTNFSQILSSQDDGNPADNDSSWLTTVTTGCTIPVVNSGPSSLTNCPGTPATFSVSASGTGLHYQWRKGGVDISGQTSSNYTIGSVSSLDAGLYSAVITNQCGSVTSSVATLVVNSNVLVTVPPANSTNCPGTTANFSVTATGTGLSYQWYKGAGLLGGQTGSTLSLPGVTASSAGVYSVVVSGTCGNAVTNSATLVVNSNVLVTVPPSNSTNCPGTTANFSVTATGTGLSYQWYKGAGLLGGQTGSTLSLPGVTASSAGVYSVVVSGTCGNAVTNSATLVVNSNVLVTVPPANSTNCPGTTANFSVTATGTGLSYQWYKGAGLLGGQTGSTLSLPGVTASSAGVYSVVVSGTCGNAVTNSATLVVNSNVLVTVPPSNSTNCPGTTANFSVTATGTGLSYQWYKGAGLLGGQTGSTLSLPGVTASSAGVYSVVVSGTCGNAVTNSATLVVNEEAGITTVPSNSTNCPGTTANFSVEASGTGVTYQWYKGTDLLSGQTGSTLTLPSVTADDAGVYSVVVGGVCGGAVTNSATLVVNANVLVTIPPSDSTNCPGTTANFSVTATGTGLTYQWYKGATLLGETSSTLTLNNVSATDAGTYTVVVSGICGSAVTNSALLVVNENVSVAPLTSVTNNIGTSVTFTAFASGTGPFSYQWYKAGQPLNGQTNSTLTLNNLQPQDNGTYSVSVSGACNGNGQAATTTVVLTVNLPPIVAITVPTNHSVFAAPATFTVIASASDPDGTVTNVQFFSSTNGVDFAQIGGTNAEPYTMIISNLPPGEYSLQARATDDLGTEGVSEVVQVTVTAQLPTVGGSLTFGNDGYVHLKAITTNVTSAPLPGLRIHVYGVTSPIVVANASGTTNGAPYVDSFVPVPPGAVVTNDILFYVPAGGVVPQVTLVVEVVPSGGSFVASGTSQAIDRFVRLKDGTFLVQFTSVVNQTYFIQYSSDMITWHTVVPAIHGNGTKILWIDSGPPATESFPPLNTTRFYRVIVSQ